MTYASQFSAIAKLLRTAVAEADDGQVPVDTIKHILRVTEAQAEAAEQGLMEGDPS